MRHVMAQKSDEVRSAWHIKEKAEIIESQPFCSLPI